MKKCFVVAICAITVLLAACGNANSTGDGDSAEVERLKNEIANVQEENKELQEGNQQSNDSGQGVFGENEIEEEDEAASWTDDTAVIFTDELFHDYIRETIKVFEEPITYGMVKNITTLELYGDRDEWGFQNWDSSNLEQLKWFTGLNSLSIYDLSTIEGDDIWLPSTLGQLVDVEYVKYSDKGSGEEQLRIPKQLKKIEKIKIIDVVSGLNDTLDHNDTLNDIAQLPIIKDIDVGVLDIDDINMEALMKISQKPSLEECHIYYLTSIEDDYGWFYCADISDLHAFISNPESYIEEQVQSDPYGWICIPGDEDAVTPEAVAAQQIAAAQEAVDEAVVEPAIP